MSEALEDMWKKFSLTEEEESDVVVDPKLIANTLDEGKACLIGKLLSRRAVNIEVMRNILHWVWKLSGGLQIQAVGDKLFIFQFEKEIEKDRVFQQSPWSFNKALLVLGEYDAFPNLESVRLEECSFWVQPHDLPLGLMNEGIGKVIGSSMGVVEEVDTCGEKVAWEPFLRVRVRIQIHKPLRRGMLLLSLMWGSSLLVFVIMRKETGKVVKEYGPWLRAEVPRSKLSKFDGPGVSVTKGQDDSLHHNRQNQNPIEGSNLESVVKGKGKAIGDGVPVNRNIVSEQTMGETLIKERADFQKDNLGLMANLDAELSAKVVLSDGDRGGSKSRKIDTVSNFPKVGGDGDEPISKLQMGQGGGRMDGIEPSKEPGSIGPDGKPVFHFKSADVSQSNSAQGRKWKREARVGGGRVNSSQSNSKVFSGTKRGSAARGSKGSVKKCRDGRSVASETKEIHKFSTFSDHLPIVLQLVDKPRGRSSRTSSFKFDNFWTRHEGFRRVVEEVWQSFGADSLSAIMRKIRCCSASFRLWNSQVYGYLVEGVG
ncbi:hypothetical protein COLO4_04212 [Corchorus olitorius]|uniref:DUF4283 domain-containing protein n=1 Tax=Corchorus olitorius TaxID=93759 RepID=A0A1R3KUZ6_9ROSI|nr:hypothetical protein COLO4_04212 [Corchorus olitorius]